MNNKVKALCIELAEPSIQIEDMLVSDRATIRVADAKSSLSAAAIPFLKLQKFHSELASTARQASKKKAARPAIGA